MSDPGSHETGEPPPPACLPAQLVCVGHNMSGPSMLSRAPSGVDCRLTWSVADPANSWDFHHALKPSPWILLEPPGLPSISTAGLVQWDSGKRAIGWWCASRANPGAQVDLATALAADSPSPIALRMVILLFWLVIFFVSFRVWCYIWEGTKLKKVNLTLLDIGWSLIQVCNSSMGSFSANRRLQPGLIAWNCVILPRNPDK